MLRIQKKDTQTSTKRHECNKMTKWTTWYFQQCACVNAIAPVFTTTYRMKNNKSSTRDVSLELSVLAKARAQLLNMLCFSTHLSVPHGNTSSLFKMCFFKKHLDLFWMRWQILCYYYLGLTFFTLFNSKISKEFFEFSTDFARQWLWREIF